MEVKLVKEASGVAGEGSGGEMTKEPVRAGALQISTQYRAGRISGLSWSMPVRGHEACFSMPARVDGVYRIFADRQQGYLSEQLKAKRLEKAQRVAWRHLYRWVQAQTAMIATGMMEPAEPFIPFVTIPGSTQTLFEAFAETGRLLAAPETKP